MTFIVGKAFQAAGIVCVPLALFYGIGKNDLKTEFRVWLFALLLFFAGWLIERKFPRAGR